jgi:selenocysteine-specific elongation factor
MNASKKKLDEVLKGLKARKRVISYDKERGALIHADFLQTAREEIVDTIRRYHDEFPLRIGLQKEELRSRTEGAKNVKLFNYVINQLTKGDVVVQEKENVRLKEHQVTLARDQEMTRQRLEEIYRKSGLQPPYFKEIKGDFPGNMAEDVLAVMLEEGVVIKVKEDLYFYRAAVEGLQDQVAEFLKEHGEITTPQFKDMTGVSRKYAIPLIEYFDKTQITVRVGDSRVLRKK